MREWIIELDGKEADLEKLVGLRGGDAGWRVERDDRRVAIGIQVDYRIGENKNKVVHAFTRDLSSSGMFIITRDTLPVGDVVDLEFILPGSPDKINVAGKVVRSFHNEERGHYIGGMGLLFTDVTDEVQGRLEQFIHESITI